MAGSLNLGWQLWARCRRFPMPAFLPQTESHTDSICPPARTMFTLDSEASILPRFGGLEDVTF